MDQPTIFHLGTCSTCRRILDAWKPGPSVRLQDVKTDPLTPAQLDALVALAGRHEALFSRRALKFRALGLHEHARDEADYRRLLLEEYTFLRRPVLWLPDAVFAGSAKATVAAAGEALRARGLAG